MAFSWGITNALQRPGAAPAIPKRQQEDLLCVLVWTRDIDTRQFGPEDENLFLRYSLAHAKTILGEIRSKWDSMPMVGGDKGLNGQALIEEARTEKEQLEKDAINWRRATPIIME